VFDGRVIIDGSAAASSSRGTFAQASVEVPRLAGDHFGVGGQVKRQDFTRLGYFGIGANSLESDATDYRLENTDYLVFANVKPQSGMIVGARIGYSPSVTIERPRAANDPATQDHFTIVTAPGLGDTPAFLHGAAYVTLDTRDHPSRPTSGGDYRLTVSAFNDRDSGSYSFRQMEAEASQFIPILNEHSVIALRGRVVASDTANGGAIPFYVLPTLGGSRSLRGYDDYRFRDRNLLLLNAEYRWRVFGAIDGALFYDAGKVAPRFGDLDLTHLKSSYGIGFRAHSGDTTVFRVDIGRGSEGTRLLVSLTDALRPGHGSIFIPYVP
jgi:outer membrane protein assembly factor BamA